MSFFDKFREQATVVRGAAGNVAQNAVKQTKSLAAVGKIKIAIASEEDKVKQAYTELGRLFYRDYAAGTEATMEDYQPWCDKISEAKAAIAKLNEDMAAARAMAETPAPEPEAAPLEEVTEVVEEVVLEREAPAEEAPAEAEAPAPEEVPAPEIPEAPVPPVVDTLYVDETNTEE